jgi:hypothetical protein
MKITGKLFLLAMALSFLSCEENFNVEEEKAAIIKVIEQETGATYQKEWQKRTVAFLQSDDLTLMGVNGTDLTYRVGWEEIEDYMSEVYTFDTIPSQNTFQNDNYRIRIYPECAFAVYHESVYDDEGVFLRKFICTRMLEKQDGAWKIVYCSWVNASDFGWEL